MRTAPVLIALALIAALLFVGCDSDGSTDGTYPPPSDFAEVSVEALAMAAPGRYNTRAYVAHLVQCPRGSYCLIAGSVTLVSDLGAAPEPTAVTIYLDDAMQHFKVGQRYLVSVEVENTAPPPKAVRLLGYSRL